MYNAPESVVVNVAPAFLNVLGTYYPPKLFHMQASPSIAKVPVAFGKLTVLSLVGSTAVNVVSNAFA